MNLAEKSTNVFIEEIKLCFYHKHLLTCTANKRIPVYPKPMKKYCLTLDLKDDADLIAEYEEQHKAIWPEITDSITTAGITHMEIYRLGTRLFMIIEADESFNFSKKAAMDAGNAKVQQWENLMWKYQQPIKGALAGEKWVLMDKIFQL
jgi:L-rhamnose mutarotase